MTNKHLLIYVHYNKSNSLADYAVYQLKKITPLFDRVVFVTNSQISIKDKTRLSEMYTDYIQRENVGFDFAAWRDGLNLVGWKELNKYSSVTLMNDTCFGPIYPMRDVYEKMEHKNIDFWGITDHNNSKDGMPGTNKAIPYHIQSYMMVYNNNVIKSEVFKNFWEGVKDYKDVYKVIQQYETKLTGLLKEAGFNSGVYFDTISYSKKNNVKNIKNYSEFMPLVILRNRVPLIKIKSFLHTSSEDLFGYINNGTTYNTDIIKTHLKHQGILRTSIKKRIVGKHIEPHVRHLARSNKIKGISKRLPMVARISRKGIQVLFGINLPLDNSAQIDSHDNSQNNFLVTNYYNKDLAQNYAEHLNIIQDNKTYWCDKESTEEFKRGKDDPRIVAIYLPQFHPFKENNEAWGKGFTEWTNVTASIPRFVGQQQPTLPSDLGYYDLRTPGIIKQQIDLAKKYGIYGFQFYYYWFSGQKVMDLPINTLLDNPEWDFNFSICWANENWTKKWDGGDKDIIFEQKDLPDDPLKFIRDVAPILNDERYIKEDDKPILTVYRVDLLGDPRRYAKIWREYFKKEYNKELWLIGCTNFKNFKPSEYGFDALMDFTPTGSTSSELKPWVGDDKIINNKFSGKLLDVNWNGLIADYRYIAKQEIANLNNNINDYKTISPSWCNEARRKGKDGVTFQNSSPEIFASWLDSILDHEININEKKKPIVYINAWNEWAESAMLEPSTHLGHNTLRRIAEATANYSSEELNKKAFPRYGMRVNKNAKLAVVVHLYYLDMWSQLEDSLSNIDQYFDLYISVPVGYGDISIGTISKYHKNTNIVVVPNRGRDVLPFVTIMNRIRKFNYEYVLKLHTKKSKHRSDGSEWFNDIISNLLPNNQTAIRSTLAEGNTGIIGPSGHVVSLSRHLGSNEPHLAELVSEIDKTKVKKYQANWAKYPFIGSTMFWARINLLTPLLDLYLLPSDFESESGQIDGTLAHAIERLMGGVLHNIMQKNMYSVDAAGIVKTIDNGRVHNTKYKFAP